METQANIVEIFSSLQGEGRYMGVPMTFVRFAGCSLRCAYCDTRAARVPALCCRVEEPPRSQRFREKENPLAVEALCDLMEPFDDGFVGITGGEPLEQADFLAEWLPKVGAGKRVLLETNGVMHSKLERVLPWVSVVSMDIKLPSSTGSAARWEEHEKFLRAVIDSGREAYLKVVVTAGTSDSDVERAVSMVKAAGGNYSIYLQPVSDTPAFEGRVTGKRLFDIARACCAQFHDVRVMPQMHKQWGLP